MGRWLGAAFLDGRSEGDGETGIAHGPNLVLDILADNSETMSRLDDLVDLLLDEFTANPHAVSGTTLLEPVSVSEVEIDGPYRGVAISLAGLIQEGRT